MKIRPATRDICNYCWDFCNGFRMIQRRSETKSLTLDQTEEQEKRDQMVRDANTHVKQAQAQRDYCNSLIAKAQEDTQNKEHHSESTRTIVIDFAQNCDLPSLNDEQAGEAYYFSPLKVNVFGIVDAGVEGGHLHSFVYHDGEGGKGGNNVASMIILYLKRKGWLTDNKTQEMLHALPKR